MRKIIGLFFIAFSLLSSCAAPEMVKLNVDYQTDGALAHFANKDTFDYNDVDIEINDTYKVHVDKIPAGETYTVALRDFVDGDQRLNIITTQVQKIDMLVETAKGTGFESWSKK